MAKTLSISLRAARDYWSAAQCLRQRSTASPVAVVRQTGWIRTLGGVSGYLAVHARAEGITTRRVDEACAAGELHVVPAARGCIYLVPDDQVGLALGLASHLGRKRIDRDCEKVGVPASELAAIVTAATSALADGPLSTAAIKKALPDALTRSLGDVGKKVGMSTALPAALRLAEYDGTIERHLEKRLDAERYVWALRSSPLEAPSKTTLYTAVASHFFTVTGPSTEDDFVIWSGLSKTQARQGMKAARLQALTIDGQPGEWWCTETIGAALQAPAPLPSRATLLSFNDAFISNHGTGPLTDPAFHDRGVKNWGARKPALLGEGRTILQRLVTVDGELVGGWDYDPTKEQAVWAPFDPSRSDLASHVEPELELVSSLLREHGHGRMFSLDKDAVMPDRAARLLSEGPFQ